MAAPFPLCVIGGGSIGLRHATQAMESPHIHLGAVVEPDAQRRDMLLDMGLPAVPDIDAVPAETKATIIATPTPDHLPSGLAAIAQGWAVLVEKPLTPTIEEATALCAAADQAGVLLATGHHRRFHPFVAEARATLSKIGRPVAIQGLWSLRKHDSYYDAPWRRAPGAGPIQTNLSHEVDLLRVLFGEIAEVSAMTANAARGLAIEDTAAISFRFSDGMLGSFLISDAGASPWAFEAASGENPEIAASGQDYIHVTGTKGAMAFPSLTLWRAAGSAPPDWRYELMPAEAPQLPKLDPIRAQLESFARAAQGADEKLLARGMDGRANVAVIEAVLNASVSGRTEKI